MKRRYFLELMIAGLASVGVPAMAETKIYLKELIALTKKAPKTDMASLGSTAKQAAKYGWICPTKGSQLNWLGKWTLIDYKGNKVTLTMLKGGKVRADGGSKIWFKEWTALSKPGSPMLMSLSDGTKTVYYQPYQRPGAIFLSNYSNRKQYMTLTYRK